MTERTTGLRTLLAQLPVSDPPLAALAAEGERGRRRRRGRVAIAGAATAVVAVVGMTGLLAQDRPSGDGLTTTGPPPEVVDLAGPWRVDSFTDVDGRETMTPQLRRRVLIRFDGEGPGTMHGDDGCNAFGAPYSQDGASFEVRPRDIESTAQLCGNYAPIAERLPDVERVRSDGDDILLLEADGEPVGRLTRVGTEADLEGRWVVAALEGPTGSPVLSPRLRGEVAISFQAGALSADDGCAVFSGIYRHSGLELRLSTDPPLVEPLCPRAAPLALRLGVVRHVSGHPGEVLLHDEDWRVVAVLRRT